VIGQIAQPRESLIFFRKYGGIGLDRPIYTEVLIVPENTRVVAGTIIGSNLIINLGLVLQRAITVEETVWHP
jgi:hypothetical protein